MAEVQALDKPGTIKYCSDLADHFVVHLTEYLASKTLEKGCQSKKCMVVAWSCRCEATHMDASHLASNHEEADTKLLLYAVDATISGTTSVEIMSPDTDVFVLSLRRFAQLCQNTTFVTGRGEHL